ncbi:MAG: flavin reductase family protein [Zavarzinia sp.]|nr:flavin reductase family protein [Zavarzinia sp.]
MNNAGTRGTPPLPTAVSAGDFRHAVSRFATGITVVTSEGADCIRGMTCNSFTSVSLDPATILVSLKPGKSHAAIASSGRFGVSVLRDEHQAFSTYFSGRTAGGEAPEFVVRHEIPTLKHCLAWFECEVARAVPIHDHTVFVAQVVACGTDDGAPLVFFDSHYHVSSPMPVNRLPERDRSPSAS